MMMTMMMIMMMMMMMMMMMDDLPNDRFFATQLGYCAAQRPARGQVLCAQLDYCAAYSWPMRSAQVVDESLSHAGKSHNTA